MAELPNAVTQRGKSTSEFRALIGYVIVMIANAVIRAKFGKGLSEIEMGQITAAFGVYWYGRDSLKKQIIKENGKETT